MSRVNLYQVCCLLIAVGALALSFGTSGETEPLNAQVEAYQNIEQVTSSLVPVLDNSISNLDLENFLASISAESIYVMDVDSAAILLEKNSSLVKAPASTTKLLTALVARRIYDLDQVLEVQSETKTLGNVVGLYKGEKISVKNLLQAALIQSGNDAAYVLANNHPQGMTGFIQQMNDLAGQLNLTNSYFTNPAGFDNDYHQTTARDLAILTKEVIRDGFLSFVVGTKETTIQDTQSIYQHHLFSTNSLLGVEDGVIGVKTGTTEKAGEALITQFKKDNKNIVIVVLSSQDRYLDTKQIIDFVQKNYDWKELSQLVTN